MRGLERLDEKEKGEERERERERERGREKRRIISLPYCLLISEYFMRRISNERPLTETAVQTARIQHAYNLF